MFKVPGLSLGLQILKPEAAQFEADISSVVQSFIQPGLATTANTATEMQLLRNAIGGVDVTPKSNARALQALMNGRERSKHQHSFFNQAQKQGLTVQDAQDRWSQYIEGNEPYIVTKNNKVERNPSFKTPGQWAKSSRSKAPSEMYVGGRRFVEQPDGSFIEQ